MRVGGQRHAPASLRRGKRPGTHCIGGLMGPRAGMGRCGKSCLPLGFDPQTVKSVASRYTDCVIPALCQTIVSIIVHSNAHKVIAGFFLSPDPEVT
jgi:hypothetical protein